MYISTRDEIFVVQELKIEDLNEMAQKNFINSHTIKFIQDTTKTTTAEKLTIALITSYSGISKLMYTYADPIDRERFKVWRMLQDFTKREVF